MADMVKVWWHLNGGRSNFGDVMNPWLVRKMTGKMSDYPVMKGLFIKEPHYFMIGSILSNTNKLSEVWGSGMLTHDDVVFAEKFHAVRGPHTRDLLMKMGKKVPAVYGDPAILAPKYFQPANYDKLYQTAIIPHYVDYDKIREQELANKTGRLVINVEDSVETIVQQIANSERVVSSSLHGVIVAHSYNVPVLWAKFSNKLIGSDKNLKFHDYFNSMDTDFYAAAEMPNGVPTDGELDKLFDKMSKHLHTATPAEKKWDALLQACPLL